MKRMMVAACILALSACGAPTGQAPGGQTPAGQASAGKPAESGAQPATPPTTSDGKPGDAAQAPALQLNAAFMIGRWGDNGDCTKDIVINGDGTFHSYTGGEGAWTLNGDQLQLEGKNGSFGLQLEIIDQNSLRITNPDGSVGTSQRCS